MKLKPLELGDQKIKYPVIQGGMGVGISLSSLAGAVAREGGIGIISIAQIGYREPDFDDDALTANLRRMGEELKLARKIAPEGCIGFNIMVAAKGYEKYARRAVECGADIIVSGAGLPMDLPNYVKGSATKIAPIVSSVKSAKVICKFWDRHYGVAPDMVIIEGPRAGGHLGFTIEQLNMITEEEYEREIRGIIEVIESFEEKYKRRIPVIVAGGIYSHDDLVRQLELGADGVQVGSRFVTTYECDASMAYKQTYIDAKKEDIIIVKSPVGMPGRAIANGFLKLVEEDKVKITSCHKCLSHCNPATIPYCITDALLNAVKGNVDQALLFCGAKAYKAEKLETVHQVMMDLVGQN